MIVSHLLLAPVSTVVKPAEHEFVRRQSLLLEAKTTMTGCRVKRTYPQFLESDSRQQSAQSLAQ